MGTQWRFIDIGPQGPFEATGRAPILGQQVAEGGDPTVFTAVWGQTHVNVGWFDDVDATLDLDACARLGVEVVRRPVYGGGTAFYQEGCAVMCSFLMDKEEHPDLDEALTRLQPVMLDCLDRLGLGEVRFEGSSDLRWRDRKLGALTAQDVVTCNSVGGFINIAPPDVDLYLEVARVPDDKFADKVVTDLRDYVVTAEEIAGEPISYEQFRDALLAALRAAGYELYEQPMTDEERAGVRGIAEDIADDDFVRKVSSERFRAAAPPSARVGFGNEKGRKLCRAGVALDGEGVVVDAMMAGDMHVGPPDTMRRVADNLVGADGGDEEQVRARIAEVFEGPDVRQPGATMGVTTDDLLAAVRKAVADATDGA